MHVLAVLVMPRCYIDELNAKMPLTMVVTTNIKVVDI